MIETDSKLPLVCVYTDGGCRPNPGLGAWADILIWENTEQVIVGRERDTTNNRMELMAAIEALSSLAEAHRVQLFTDSQYLKQGITQWLPRWENNQWRTASGKRVKNRALWQRLSQLAQAHLVDWQWLAGHKGDRMNERAHRLVQGKLREG